jgi:hypothetical protein
LTLDSTVVDLAVGPEALPASPLSESTTRPFSGQLAAGDEAVGVYAFSLPDTARGGSTVTVTLGAGSPTVALRMTL